MPHDFCIHMMNRALEMCGLCERSERDFATQQWRDWNAKADELQAQLAEAQDQIIKNSERYTADRENWQAQMTGLTEALDNDPKVRGLEAALLEAQERIEEESKAYVNMMELRDVEIRKLSKMTNERDAALARVAQLENNLHTAVDYLMQAKAQFAPHTDNSFVDIFIEDYCKSRSRDGGKGR